MLMPQLRELKVADTPYTIDELKDRIEKFCGPERVPKRIRIITDTTDFFRVDYDDVVLLEDRAYFIRNYEREGRFGIDEEPKFWVRRAVDLEDGSTKIIKMVFHEYFTADCGGIPYECARSPRKEARVLGLVQGHERFMQGGMALDSAGNVIRVIDYIRGKTFAHHAFSMGMDHEDYYTNHLKGVLEEFMGLLRGIAFLHGCGETHGDIRRDHIIMDKDSGKSRWIDFDFECIHGENKFGYDMAGLGNVLLFLAGKGEVTVQELSKSGSRVLDGLHAEDMGMIFSNRVVNLRKVFPYVSSELNNVLMHFSAGSNVFYMNVSELIDELEEAMRDI